VSYLPKPQAEGPPIVGCPLMCSQHFHSYFTVRGDLLCPMRYIQNTRRFGTWLQPQPNMCNREQVILHFLMTAIY